MGRYIFLKKRKRTLFYQSKCVEYFRIQYKIYIDFEKQFRKVATTTHCHHNLVTYTIDASQVLPRYVYEQSPDKNLVPTFFCVHRAFWSSDFWSVVIKFSQVCLKQYSRITRMPFVWSLNTFLIFNLIMTNEPRGLFVMTIYAE